MIKLDLRREPRRRRRDGTRHRAARAQRSHRSGSRPTTRKQDALELADKQGAAFMSLFTTFGSFSIAAGILLIFLIFVMLAAERRGELGIARAVGTRRGHLVQMFLFEGLAYDLIAAAVGALLGVGVAYGMVLAMAAAFKQRRRRHDHVLRDAREHRDRLRDRRAPDARGRRVLGLAREPHEHRQRDPQPARPAGHRQAPRRAGCSERPASCSARCSRRRRARRGTRSRSASASCSSLLSLVPVAARARRPRAARLHGRGARARGVVRAADEPLAVRRPARRTSRSSSSPGSRSSSARAGRSCTTPTSCSVG